MKRFLTVLLSVILLFSVSACGGKKEGNNASSESPNEVAEDSKQSAIDFDSELWSIITTSENFTTDLLTMLDEVSTGESTLLDVYDSTKTMVYAQNDLRSSIPKGDENADEYISAANTYILNAFGIASNLQQYIDTNEIKYLSDAKSSIESAQTYAIEVVAQRMAYLSDAGLSNEEISEIMGTADSSENAAE